MSMTQVKTQKVSFLKNHQWTFLFLLVLALLVVLKEILIVGLWVLLLVVGVKNSKQYLPMVLLLLSMMIFFNPLLGALPSPLWNASLMMITALFVIKKKFHFNKLEIAYTAVLASFLLTALLNSPLLSIAVIKVISLSIFAYAVFKTFKWGYINEKILRQIVEAMVLAGGLLYFTSYGYYKNGLFMGIFNHSQSIGLFLVPLLVYYMVSFLERKRVAYRESLFSYAIIVLGIVEMLATYSRTSIFTFFVLILIYLGLTKINAKNIQQTLTKPLRLFLLIMALGVLAISVPKIINAAQHYIYKSFRNDLVQSAGSDNVLSSRQKLFDESLSNFQHNPLVGNGFGVQYRNGALADNKMKYLPLLNVPYTMVNEKGNVYLMVLEEGGLITFSLFVLFLLFQLKETRKYRPALYPSIAIMTQFNGEATLFSLNGVGAFQFVFLIMMYFLAKQQLITREIQ